MSNELARYQPSQSLSRLPRREVKAQRAIDVEADLQAHYIDRRAEVGNQRVRALVRVGTRVLEAQAVVSMTERLIVEMEAGAVHGVSYLSQRLTIGLGQVLDKAIEEVTR